MTRVPEFYRNQHTTLDAAKAKNRVASTCERCGTGLNKVKRYCAPCATDVMAETNRARLKRRAQRIDFADADLSGKVIGYFTVIGRGKKGARGWSWLVRCACSNEILVAETFLRSARKTHCGCKSSEAA